MHVDRFIFPRTCTVTATLVPQSQITDLVYRNVSIDRSPTSLRRHIHSEAMEALRDPPNAAEFTPLAEHRAATPASFYTGPPVLHYHSDRSKVLILEREVAGNAVLEPLLQHAQAAGEPQPNGHDQSSDAQKVLEEVDVWVTSQYVSTRILSASILT